MFNSHRTKPIKVPRDGKPLPHEKHGSTSDWVGVTINGILAILTLIAIYYSYRSNKTAQDALSLQIEKDKVDGKHQAYLDSINRSKDSVNHSALEKSLSYAKINADASIMSANAAATSTKISENIYTLTKMNSIRSDSNYLKSLTVAIETLKDSKKKFENENRSIIYFDKFDFKKIQPDSALAVNITIQNYGRSPANIISMRTKFSFDTAAIFQKFGYDNQTDKKYVNLLLTQNKWVSLYLFDTLKLHNSLISLIQSGTIKVFFHGEVFYYDVSLQKYMAYTFCMRIYPNGLFEMNGSHNEIMEISNPRDLKILN